MVGEEVVHRWRVAPAVQRHGEQPGRLVDDDEVIVFINDSQGPDSAGERRRSRAARPIHPDADRIAFRNAHGGLLGGHLGAVQEDLSALDRDCGTPARSEAIRAGQELVEPDTGGVAGHRPL